MLFIDYKGLSTVSVERQNSNCFQSRILHQTIYTDALGLSDVCVLPGGSCIGAVYLGVTSCCSYQDMNYQQTVKNKTLVEQAEVVRQNHYHQHMMQSTFPFSGFFKNIMSKQTKCCANAVLCQPECSYGSVQGEPKCKKFVNSFPPCRLSPCRVGLWFQAIQWLSELQQTLHLPLLAFENFSLHHFRDLAVCLIKCPSCYDRMVISKFLLIVAPEDFSPQSGPVLLQKASIQVACIEET